jgi:hypothetical protein
MGRRVEHRDGLRGIGGVTGAHWRGVPGAHVWAWQVPCGGGPCGLVAIVAATGHVSGAVQQCEAEKRAMPQQT